MLLFRGLAGLGVNPAMKDTFNKELVQNGGQSGDEGVWSDKAGTINLTPHYWHAIGTEAGWPDADADGNTVNANESPLLAAYNRDVQAVAMRLPSCPLESMEPATEWSGSVCYGHNLLPVASPGTARAPGQPSLLAPFTFEALGTVFALSELAHGQFQHTFQPSPEQRKKIELALIEASTHRFFGPRILQRNFRQLIGDQGGAISGATGLIRQALTHPTRQVELEIAQGIYDDPSVDAMLALVPDMALYLINFERNSVQPTPTERTTHGGWKAWLMRGGYPLSRALATAQAPMISARPLQVCSSIACRCGEAHIAPNGVSVGGSPSCKPLTLVGSGVYENRDDPSGEWATYLSISQDPAQAWVQVTVRYKDPSKWDQLTYDLGRYAEKVSVGVCAALGANKEQISALGKEVCTDASGKTCTKGTAGCTCKQPSQTQKLSLNAFNAWTQYQCGKIMIDFDETDSIQNLPPPQNAPQPPLPVLTKVPWWLVGLGGAVLGAAIFVGRNR